MDPDRYANVPKLERHQASLLRYGLAEQMRQISDKGGNFNVRVLMTADEVKLIWHLLWKIEEGNEGKPQ